MQKEVKAKRQQYLCQQPGRNRLQQVVPFEWSMIYKSSLDLKTILRKFLSKRALTGRVLGPHKLQHHTNEGRGKDKRNLKGGEAERWRREKSKVAFLVFIIATFYIFFVWKKKKLLEANGTFSANVIKNPARYVSCNDIIYIIIYINNFSLLAMPRLWLIFICLSFPLLSGPDAVGMPMWSSEKGDRESHLQALRRKDSSQYIRCF